jgi:hypothetical protein
MSRSMNRSLHWPTTSDDPAKSPSPPSALPRTGRGALWCALAASVFALSTSSTARAQGAPSTPAPSVGQAPAAEAAAAPAPQDQAEACLENHAQGQEFRLSSKLLQGRDAFLKCSATSCPAQIQRDCLNYLEQIQLQIPSVAFRVSADGVSRADVQVYVDGQLALDKLSGKALDLNPGSHDVKIVLPPFAPHEETLVVNEGDKFRMVEVKFASPVVAAAEHDVPQREMHRPIPVSSYVFGGVGAAALISGVAWGLSSAGLKGDLENGCAPRCPKDSVDVLRQRSLIADVSWGVSAASLAVAGIFYLVRPEVPVEGSVEVGLTWLGDHGAIGTISVPTF